MQTNFRDGTSTLMENLTAEEVLDQTKANLSDPNVVDFKVWPNRHERRRHEAQMRQSRNGVKSDNAHSRKKGNRS